MIPEPRAEVEVGGSYLGHLPRAQPKLLRVYRSLSTSASAISLQTVCALTFGIAFGNILTLDNSDYLRKII